MYSMRSYRPRQNIISLKVARCFSSNCSRRSDIAPEYPERAHSAKIRRPGRTWAEPLDKDTRLSYHPIYRGPSSDHIAFTKRASLGFCLLGCYVSHLLYASPSVSEIWPWLTIVPLAAPVPIFGWLSKPYVSSVYRLYRSNEEQTYENLTKDETLVVDRIGFFGRSVYATQIKVRDLRVVNERFGWVNWIYTDPESGEVIKMYVADNIGGMKMDRIWGIAERNSGIDNGRDFYDRDEMDDK